MNSRRLREEDSDRRRRSGVKVTGDGRSAAAAKGRTIRIRTTGHARVLHATKPSFLIRPQYLINGKEWMACWTDYPNNGPGTYDQT